MKHIVCFSGGHSSAMVALEVVKQFGKENTVLVNHDITSRSELADVKRFKQEVANYIGLPITYVNHPQWETMDQFDVCIEAGTWVNPNTRTILCTHRLKTEPFYNWLKNNYQSDDVIYYGFDANEPSRITRRSAILGSDGYKSDYPLATFQDRTFFRSSDIGIEPPMQYDYLNHANCIGCLKAGWQHWYVIYCFYRATWNKGKASEDIIGYSIHSDGFLEDKEPLFELMRQANIPATEKISSQKFWATVKRALKGQQISIFDLPDYERATECMGDCGIERFDLEEITL